jgi:hypothetical protein
MLKFADNPPMRPPAVDSVAAFAGEWWVAHTKPRFEKALAFDLLALGVAYYLPLVERVTVSGGRKRRALMPLFPSYLFFCGAVEAKYAALATSRVVQVIHARDRARFVAEIVAVEMAIARNARLDLYPFAVIGTRCRVRSGPLIGIEGTIVRRDDRAMLVLNVGMLGTAAALEMDAELLEPVEGPACTDA